MNVFAHSFIPDSLKQLSIASPSAIYYPTAEQLRMLGFIDCVGVRKTLDHSLPLSYQETKRERTENLFDLEPNWNFQPDEDSSNVVRQPNSRAKVNRKQSAEWIESLLDWLNREWVEREKAFLKYEQPHARIRLKSNWIKITVPGLADADPPILVGDWVLITFQCSSGIIHQVFPTTIGLLINEQVRTRVFLNMRSQSVLTCVWPEGNGIPQPPDHANVKLFESLIFHGRLKKAVEIASHIPLIEELLYPSSVSMCTFARDETLTHEADRKFVNQQLNFKQKEFVHLAIREPISFPCNIRILFGPPGTGKTMVAVETVLQILLKTRKSKTKSRILVCAPSISAADTLALRLLAGLQYCKMDAKDVMFRLNEGARSIESLPSQLLAVCSNDPESGKFIFPSISKFLSFQIVVCTCLDAAIAQECGFSNQNLYTVRQAYHQSAIDGYETLGIPPAYHVEIPEHHWTHLVIDEAGQASELETLIPITCAWSPRLQVFLFGDPRQLACRVFNKLNKETSLMERLLKNELYANEGVLGKITNPYNSGLVVLLSHNYRSHCSLLMTPSVLFYYDEIVSCGDSAVINKAIGYRANSTSSSGVAFDWPVFFTDVKGQDTHSIHTLASWANREEADAVVASIIDLFQTGIAQNESEVAVITPFRGQVALIRSLLRKAKYSNISVGNVLDFQGKECGIVLVSCVRSVNKLANGPGFMGRPKEFNVAITRAKALLLVFGNQDLLMKDGWIRQFILFCNRHKKCLSTQDIDVPPLSHSKITYADTPPPMDKSLQSGLERRWIQFR